MSAAVARLDRLLAVLAGRSALAAAAFLDLALPAVCPACRWAPGPGLCQPCLDLVQRARHPCRRCAAPRRGPAAPCQACAGKGLSGLRTVTVGCTYAGVVEDLVGAAKAGSRPAAIRALAGLLPTLPTGAGWEAATAVVPVPPSPGRRPGPHLGSALARALARRQGLPLRRLLAPTRCAAEQHRLAQGQRRRNVAGLFTALDAPAHVLLVDDLLTSGATAGAAAMALRAAGARRVDLVCLARTPRRGEAPG